MANPEHLAKLMEGVEAWNKWMEENPDVNLIFESRRRCVTNLGGSESHKRTSTRRTSAVRTSVVGTSAARAYTRRASTGRISLVQTSERRSYPRQTSIAETSAAQTSAGKPHFRVFGRD